MKIKVVPYSETWPLQFDKLEVELKGLLSAYDVAIEHIGSTSVAGLAAKPIIDIQVGVPSLEVLDEIIDPMMACPNYIYYQVFNDAMPNRRLFVRLQDGARKSYPAIFKNGDHIPHAELNELRMAHVHVWQVGSEDWMRHLAYRDYLRAHPTVKSDYAKLKVQLATQEWEHGMAYSEAKDEFISLHEQKAITWYQAKSEE